MTGTSSGAGVRLPIAMICAAVLLLASCSSDSGFPTADSQDNGGSSGGSRTADIDVCTLLTDAELTAVFGSVPVAEPTGPAGPFTGCSWGTGKVIVQIATSDSLIIAPTQADCPSPGLGDESIFCDGQLKFLTSGIHVSVTTIENLTDNQFLTLSTAVLQKLP